MKFDKKIRKDHRLMIEVRQAEQRINDICNELTIELGVDVDWEEVKKLANGATLRDLGWTER